MPDRRVIVFCRRRRHLRVHRIEGQRLELDGLADGRVAKIDQDIEALRRSQKGLLGALRRGQQTAVVADQYERNGGSGRGAKSQVQRARVACIQKPQAVHARRDIEIRARISVDVKRVTEEAVHRIRCGPRVRGIRAAVLQHERNFGTAWNEIQRLAQRFVVLVLDFEHSEQPVVQLLSRRSMRMRVIPVKSAAVTHREVVRETLARPRK